VSTRVSANAGTGSADGEVDMPYFTFRHLNAKTGRTNKARRRAFDAAHLAELAAAEGLQGLTDIVAEAEPPPSQRQIDYLRDLGGRAELATTSAEASDLIDNALGRRDPAGERERGFARLYRVEATRFASKAAIFRAIAIRLADRADRRALVEWYAFRVYRDACDRASPAVIDTPSDGRLCAVAAKLLADDKVVSSIRRDAGSADGWRWFGTFRGADGFDHSGASRSTAAYKTCLAALRSAGLVPETRPRPDRGAIHAAGRPEGGSTNRIETDGARDRNMAPPAAWGQWAQYEPPPRRVSWWKRLLGLG
jgi:hypothetical protein